MLSIPVIGGQPSEPIVIDGSYLPTGACKLYMNSSDTPIAIETDEKIVYVAPVVPT